MDDSLRVYFAGDIFNHKDLVGNLLLADAIKSVSDGRYHCILPQNLEQTTGRSIDIRNQDLLEVMRADWILEPLSNSFMPSRWMSLVWC